MNSTATPRTNLSDAVEDLAPGPPPCFHNRAEWIQYLKSAAAVQYHKGEQKVIFARRVEASFNYEFDYCEDCHSARQAQMVRKGLCHPDYVKDRKPK